MPPNPTTLPQTNIGRQLLINPFYKIGEILFLFLFTVGFITILTPLVGEDPLYKQMVVWLANILMLVIIWLGLKLRGESWAHFGLTLNSFTWKEGFKGLMLSLLVLFFGLMGFVLGSIIMANITGIPESTDLTGYSYLEDNLGMLMLSLTGVYIVSSFGEEVIYRGFLMNRISELGGNTKIANIVALILSAVIFGLVHYEWGPMGVVQTGFMGLAFGICYLKFKKRLWLLITAHAVMDTVLLVQIYLASN